MKAVQITVVPQIAFIDPDGNRFDLEVRDTEDPAEILAQHFRLDRRFFVIKNTRSQSMIQVAFEYALRAFDFFVDNKEPERIPLPANAKLAHARSALHLKDGEADFYSADRKIDEDQYLIETNRQIQVHRLIYPFFCRGSHPSEVSGSTIGKIRNDAAVALHCDPTQLQFFGARHERLHDADEVSPHFTRKTGMQCDECHPLLLRIQGEEPIKVSFAVGRSVIYLKRAVARMLQCAPARIVIKVDGRTLNSEDALDLENVPEVEAYKLTP
jgi:hypothetical protein